MSDMSDKTKQAWVDSMGVYDQTDTSLSQVGRGIFHALTDPVGVASIVAGVGVGGLVKLLGSRGAAVAGRTLFKDQLKKKLLKEGIKEPTKEMLEKAGKEVVKSRGREQALRVGAAGAGWGTTEDLLNQSVDISLDYDGDAYLNAIAEGKSTQQAREESRKSEIDETQVGISALFGGVFGGVLGRGLSRLGSKKELKKVLDKQDYLDSKEATPKVNSTTSILSDGTSDKVKLFFNGRDVGTETSGVDYTGASSGALRIGYDGSNYFKGDIHEVLIYNSNLSIENRQNIEGYLARKYGLTLSFGHKYGGAGRYSNQSEQIRVVFDNKLFGSNAEPYGFLNQKRIIHDTSASKVPIRIDQASPPTDIDSVIILDGGDPRKWFETSSARRLRVTFSENSSGYPVRKTSSGEDYYGEVVTANFSAGTGTIRVFFNKTGGTHADNDYIFIEPVDYGNADFVGNDVSPVIVLPIKNADSYVRGNLSEDAVGPTHPDFQDGTVRDTTHGSDITRTDEYIAFLLSKALTADYMELGKDIDKSSTTPTMDNVYSVALSESYNGHNARLTITQKYATSLGQKNKIKTNLGAGQIPVIQDFSGGKAGKKVKSAGDKVQDLFGILANSNNFLNIQNSKSAFIDSVLDVTTGFVQQTVYDNDDAKGDYIRGIQIPYNSLATKGKDTLDSEVAQRNFFLTTNNARTSDKMSSVNTTHASRDFSHISEGHEKNGISGLISDFNVNRDAEMKAYEFSLMFIAADIIL